MRASSRMLTSRGCAARSGRTFATRAAAPAMHTALPTRKEQEQPSTHRVEPLSLNAVSNEFKAMAAGVAAALPFGGAAALAEAGGKAAEVAAPAVQAPSTMFGQTLLSPDTAYWFDSCIKIPGISGVAMGLPGLAAQAVFVAPLQAMTTIKKDGDTGMMPLLPYSSMAANGCIWCTYGYVISAPGVWLPNVPPIFLGAYYWYTFAQYCPDDANWLPGTKSMHLAGATAAVGGALGIAATQDPETAKTLIGVGGDLLVVSMFGGPLVAIKTILETKSTKALPFGFTCAATLNCSLWSVYGIFVLDDIYVWLPNILGLSSSFVQLGLFARFGIHRDD